MTPPENYELSLAALAQAGELVHLDLVFPNVPSTRESNRVWMEWAEKHPDVFEAMGNPIYSSYATAGKQPLHLQLWFRPRAQADVQRLIRDLESAP